MASLMNGAAPVQALDQPSPSLMNGGTAPLAPPPTQADAWDANSKAYGDWVAKERADGVAKGLLDPKTGWPTKAGLEDAARQLAQSVMMGTTAPGSKMPLKAETPTTWFRGASRPEPLEHDYSLGPPPDPEPFDPLDTPNPWIWMTADSKHADTFGKVHEFSVNPTKPAVIDAEASPYKELFHGGGYSADNKLYDLANSLADQGHDAVVLKNWEGKGDVMIVPQKMRHIIEPHGGEAAPTPAPTDPNAGLHNAIQQAQPMRDEHSKSLMHDLLGLISEEGSPAAVRSAYDAPKGFEPAWNAALDFLQHGKTNP